MMTYKAYKFRLYPNEKQRILIHKTFGCVRLVYNYYLAKQEKEGIKKAFTNCNDLKYLQEEKTFLKEVDSCALRCAIFNLEDANNNYFAKRSNYPVFKSKYAKQSYRTNCITNTYKDKTYSNIEIDLINRKIKLPKLGLVDIRGYRNKKEINGRIINATITKETTGKYYVSVVIEEDIIPNKKVEATSIVGIDLGVKDLITTSDGEKYDNEKYIIKYEKRLKELQRKLSRQEKGSKNYYKTKKKIAILHAKIKNARKHHIINVVNKIVKEHDIIVSERLQVKKMTHDNNLAKYILDASFYMICNLLEWKTKLLGKYYYQVDTYYPSSQICSRCEHKEEKLKDLSIRKYECTRCGLELDRDINASINIMFEGLKLHYQS